MAGITYLKYLKDDIERDIVRALKGLGRKAMLHAYLTGHTDAPRSAGTQAVKYRKVKGTTVIDSKWRHKLGNLHDSFASAVFVNGVFVGSSVQYIANPISKKKDSRTGKTGRQTVKDYLRRISFGEKNNEIVLVVVAAMFYTRWLEKEESSTGKFLVISPARDFIKQHYHDALAPVYQKYGIRDNIKVRVIEGEYIKRLSDYKKDE